MNSKTLIRVILVLIVIVIGFYLIKRTISPKKVEKEAVFLGVEGYGDLRILCQPNGVCCWRRDC